jgi:hypothetical protein
MAKAGMTEGAVTFLDVLGWKGIWTREDDAVGRLQSLIASATQRARDCILAAAGKFPELRGAGEGFVRVESISDTIVLFAEGPADPTLWLHAEICKAVVCESIERRIPIRGATCHGEYVASQDRIMVGPAIDEAASWHEAADWIGVNQTPRASFLASEWTGDPWVLYPVPVKTGRPVDLPCVNWTGLWLERHPGGEADLKRSFTEMGPLDTSIASKYLNTLAFMKKHTKA